MKIKTAVVAAIVALGSMTASASFVEYSSTISPQPVPFTGGFTVRKFDTALGTLTGVSLSLTSNITAQIDIWSALTAPANFTNASASLPITVVSLAPDSTSLTATATATVATGTALPSMPDGFINSYPGIVGSHTASTTVLPLNWSYYMGLGSGPVSFSTSAGVGTFSGTGPSGLFYSGSGAADGVFKIRYDYNEAVSAVPMRAAAWLLGSGLLSFGGAALERRQADAATRRFDSACVSGAAQRTQGRHTTPPDTKLDAAVGKIGAAVGAKSVDPVVPSGSRNAVGLLQCAADVRQLNDHRSRARQRVQGTVHAAAVCRQRLLTQALFQPFELGGDEREFFDAGHLKSR